jgi:hypothetical protein
MVTCKLVKLNNIGGNWGDLSVPAVRDCVVVSPVLYIYIYIYIYIFGDVW